MFTPLRARAFLCAAFCLTALGADLPAPQPNPPKIAAASNEGELAIKRFTVLPGFAIELYAAEPLVAHPVAFCVDEKNRIYVAESHRVGEQVTDIRKHMAWLDEELSSTNTANFRRLIQKNLGATGDFMFAESERVRLLEDVNNDGKADRSTTFAQGFNDLTSGIAAGVLARKGDVWFTCIPDLWRLGDATGDGIADSREVLHHGFAVRFGFYGHDLHGLRFGPDGKLYFSIGDRGFNIVTKDGRRVARPETGAVFRCDPDGGNLEIVAEGLRNPQELAFDQYGSLFTGDNNSDGGDQARWVYVVEGGDSGWRIGWQFLTWPVPRGPWNAEQMWQPSGPDQPAFIVPPLANFANGPSGLAYYPGTGLPDEFNGHFLMADFKGNTAQSLIHAFTITPSGASFQVSQRRPFLSGMVATDVDFGMDGAVLVSDWVDGWGKTGKGRIYRIFHPAARSAPSVAQTQQWMAQGFEHRSGPELASLLSWPDQRVRQEAQFELAARGPDSLPLLTQTARESAHQLARIHAVWAIGQIAAQAPPKLSLNAILHPVRELLNDPDPEIRAQAAKILGEARWSGAASELAKLVTDTASPRVQFFAALALGKIGADGRLQAVAEMLRENADQDPYLRHAGVMALSQLKDSRLLRQVERDDSPAVRMAALLAFRRLADPRLSRFLQDTEPRIRLEAARAIYDLPIGAAMSELAEFIRRPLASETLLRRVINANYRLGHFLAARRLAVFAADASTPELARWEAMQCLQNWENPPGRDRVTGLWRPLPPRDPMDAANALRNVLPALFQSPSTKIQIAAAQAAAKYQLNEAASVLSRIAGSETSAAPLRVEALRALTALNYPELTRLLETAAQHSDEAVRKEAGAMLARIDPGGGKQPLLRALDTGGIGEKQAALAALGTIKDAEARSVLLEWLDRLLAGTLAPEVRLELLEAAASHKHPELQSKLDQFNAVRPRSEIGPFIEALAGGNAAEGRKIFVERQEAACIRCHKAGGEGGDAGPVLDRAEANLNREYLLESIIAPNKTIAPGFETVLLTLKNGTSYAGTVKSESDVQIVLNSPEDGVVSIAKRDIESRARGGSGMPDGMGEILSKRDLRDLVEFLATLK